MIVVAICTVLLTYPAADYDEAMATCLEIGVQAEQSGEPVHTLAALAYMESRLDFDAVSHKGALGPLQVMPYWIKGSSGKIASGIKAWKYWSSRSNKTRVALAKYNAGYRPGRRSYRFADRIIRLANKLLSLVKGVSGVG